MVTIDLQRTIPKPIDGALYVTKHTDLVLPCIVNNLHPDYVREVVLDFFLITAINRYTRTCISSHVNKYMRHFEDTLLII